MPFYFVFQLDQFSENTLQRSVCTFQLFQFGNIIVCCNLQPFLGVLYFHELVCLRAERQRVLSYRINNLIIASRKLICKLSAFRFVVESQTQAFLDVAALEHRVQIVSVQIHRICLLYRKLQMIRNAGDILCRILDRSNAITRIHQSDDRVILRSKVSFYRFRSQQSSTFGSSQPRPVIRALRQFCNTPHARRYFQVIYGIRIERNRKASCQVHKLKSDAVFVVVLYCLDFPQGFSQFRVVIINKLQNVSSFGSPVHNQNLTTIRQLIELAIFDSSHILATRSGRNRTSLSLSVTCSDSRCQQ